MKSIESLARVDVLCVDKTGTITKPEMTVTEIVSCDDSMNEVLQIMLCHQSIITLQRWR